ncbi:MAG: efflux RND transporter periplasmic adaptor subunit [Fibrobacteria bacterium]
MSKFSGRTVTFAVIAILAVALLILLKPKKADAPAGGPPPAAAKAPAGANAAAGSGAAPMAPPGAGTPGPGKGAPAGGPPVPVTARVLQPQRLDNSVTSSGNVLANEEVEIRSEVQGKIRRIAFKEGARVKRGDLLVKIEDAELQATSLQAQSRRKLAEDNEYRMRMQLKIEAVSQKDYDQSLNELNLAKAESQLLRAQLDKTELRAPFGGVVGLKQISEGGFVSPATLITTLQEIDPVKVEFTVPGKYASYTKPGQAVNFTIQGSDKRYQAKIYAVDPRIDPESRTLRLRAMCPNPAGAILPGAFATIEMPFLSVDNALVIPAQALSADANGAKVFLFKGGKAMPRPVVAGLRTDSTVQITGGLAAGDTVITSGVVQIRPGSAVTLSQID